ncbi:GTP binding protein2 [Heracleum sosnowskyi]|uniref:GTP binding protein2 n=1 Tax=Heracleum sosnowskyi TaxID=360622 RepID=A0AAD8N611_9APIA|nr:GTP binding protein2 [Heracleum sosnowskyi]
MEGVSRKRGRPRVVVTEAVAEARRLAVQQRNLRRDKRKVAGYFKTQNKLPVTFTPTDLVCCRTLQGHSGKVYSLDWTPEKNRIVSASQDGRLIVWNALTSQKTHAIKLPYPWVMTCAFSPSGQSVACGGLDSICSIFNLNSSMDKDGNVPVSRMLSGHKGYVSSCQYVPDEDTHLITSSDGNRFGTGSEDGTCRLFDIRTGHQLQVYKQPNSDSNIAQDTLLAQVVLNLGSLHNSHEGRISCLGLSADGSALCTGKLGFKLKDLGVWRA